MNFIIRRRQVLHAGLAAGASLVLPSARACEFFSSTLRVFHPWTRATGDATSAIVSMEFDQVIETDRLIGVETPMAAGAEIGGRGANRALDLVIPQGQETRLSETGIYLRLVGLTSPLYIARSYPLRLVFEKGGALETNLSVDRLPAD
jgi:copper(I)-binding protein